MVQTSFDGPPDKPRNPLESLVVGAYLVGGVMLGGVVTGLIWFGLAQLYNFIGYWLLTGLPLTVLCALLIGYGWRHIDPEDPFSGYKTYRQWKWKQQLRKRQLARWMSAKKDGAVARLRSAKQSLTEKLPF